MIHILNRDVYKDGEKVGWVEGGHIFESSGKKIGYISGNDIFSYSGNKVAYLKGTALSRVGHSIAVHTDEINKEVTKGDFSDLERAAVFTLFS